MLDAIPKRGHRRIGPIATRFDSEPLHGRSGARRRRGATEGEAWTRDQLEALLQARLRPAAVVRFLVASQRRAARVRRERSDAARREALWAAAGAAAWVALAVARVEPFRRRLRSGLGGWGLTVLMLDWHLGMLETPDGRPRNLGPADAATLLRAWLVPAVADSASPWLCALGFATDAVDGPLARAGRPTRLGRDLEALVDAAFAAAALRGGRRRGVLGRPAVASEGLRLGLGIGYATASYFVRAEPPDPRLLRAARALAPVRAAGLVAAAAGRRRIGNALLVAGSAASAVVVARAAARAVEPRTAHSPRRRGAPGIPRSRSCSPPW